jgi:PmbA protein
MALRIVRDGRIGFATTTRRDDGQGLVDMAVETAQFGTSARFEFPSPVSYPAVEVFDPEIELPVENMVRLGEELISAIRDHTPDIVCEAGVNRDVQTVRIINSRGGQAQYTGSVFGLGVEGTLIRGTDMLFVGESQSSCHPLTDSKEVSKVVLAQLEMAEQQASVPGKSLPVIFTPMGIASALILPLISAFNGKTVLEGASPLGNKSGQQVFDRKLRLRDDPMIDYRPASRPCDDEGIPSRRTPLIENGVVANFLYDLQTAALAGRETTGNGSRGRGGLPLPSPSSFIIEPGEATFDEMVADVKEGLVIEILMGAGQGNVLGGDFSGNVLLGYKVESGKIVGRVKDTMVSGNIYKLLGDIAAIGSEPRWVGGSLQTPALYFSSVVVASK